MEGIPSHEREGEGPEGIVRSFDWDIIIDTIEEGNCVLVVGPGLFEQPGGARLEEQIAAYLRAQAGENIRNYFEHDALFQFRNPTAKTKAIIALKKFYREADFSHARELFRKIARIPFPIILTLTPDTLLTEVFDAEQIPYKFDYYVRNHPANRGQAPLAATARTPLIYPMFGFIKSKESLILTHDDLFDYFNSILGGSSMHPDLRMAIKNAENFIFLGVAFDKWYMQLLLKLLYRLHERDEFMRYATRQDLAAETRTLCIDQFRIEFVNQNIPQFIDELYRRAEAGGLLRQGGGGGQRRQSVAERLREQVAQGELLDSLNGLHTFLEQLLLYGDHIDDDRAEELSARLRDIQQLISRYNRLQQRIHTGVISHESADRGLNEITVALLEYIDAAAPLER